jgi:hypothetical protein
VWTAESFITLALMPAMQRGQDISCPYPVSDHYLTNLNQIQDILTLWFPGLTKIEVRHTRNVDSPRRNADQHALFFTGGLDSSYSLLKHQDRITALIFVNGFDVPLDNHMLYHKVRTTLEQTAKVKNKTLVIMHTNARVFLEQEMNLGWPDTHGLALASVAHALSAGFSHMYIASTTSYDYLYPYGSHPLLDPLWGTEELKLVHDGCEADRIEKALFLEQDEHLLQNLRVCWENRGGSFNCGECEKCKRTMIQLEIAGVLQKCTSFDKPLDINTLNIRFPPAVAQKFRQNYLPRLKRTGTHPGLEKKLDSLLSPPSPTIRLRQQCRTLWKRAMGLL